MLQVDFKNAFGSVFREQMLKQVKARCSILLPYAAACHRYPNYVFGDGFDLSSSRGVPTPPGALDPILPLDVARIIVSYLMDIYVLMVHFNDLILYMLGLEEFFRLCHHYVMLL